MKKFLIIYFILSIKAFSIIQTEKYYFGLPLDARCEAMGLTGMIYGNEYSSFFLAPTSILQRKFRKYKKVDLRANIEMGTSFEKDVFLNMYIRVHNFSIGSFCKILKIGSDKTYPLLPLLNSFIQYSFEINNFSLGLGICYIYLLDGIFNHIHLISPNFSSMFKSNYGNFSLSLSNFLSTSGKEKKLFIKYENDIYFKRNLRLGYGKEFNLNYFFNKIQLAFELDNLLMDSLYINQEEGDCALFRKFHLGICALKDMDTNSIELRLGCKNLFPTFGIEYNIKDIFKIGYTFTNIDLGDTWGKNRKIINILFIGIMKSSII